MNNKKRKITEEEATEMRKLRKEGKTLREISRQFNRTQNTVAYKIDEKRKARDKERAKKNRKPLTEAQKERKRKYTREYHANRRAKDKEFKERINKASRENWRKNHGKQ